MVLSHGHRKHLEGGWENSTIPWCSQRCLQGIATCMYLIKWINGSFYLSLTRSHKLKKLPEKKTEIEDTPNKVSLEKQQQNSKNHLFYTPSIESFSKEKTYF